MNSPSSPAAATSSSPRGGRPAWVRWASLAVLVIAAGVAIRIWSLNHLEHLQLDPTALPRPVRNAPYIATPQNVVDKMLEMAHITADDVVYDLGCGDGRIVVTAAKQFGCRAVGFDIDPERVREARENAEQNGVQDLVTIEQQDVFTVDLREASVVMIYLLPKMVEKLVPQIQQMDPGSRIVCHDFGMEDFQPVESVEVPEPDPNSFNVHRLHLWHIPLVPKAKR